MYVCMYVCMCVCMYARMCVCLYACMYVWIAIFDQFGVCMVMNWNREIMYKYWSLSMPTPSPLACCPITTKPALIQNETSCYIGNDSSKHFSTCWSVGHTPFRRRRFVAAVSVADLENLKGGGVHRGQLNRRGFTTRVVVGSANIFPCATYLVDNWIWSNGVTGTTLSCLHYE